MHGTPETVGATLGTTRPTIDPIFIRAQEAAKALSVTRAEVYNLMDQGKIQSVKHGRRRLIVVESLYAFRDALLAEVTS